MSAGPEDLLERSTNMIRTGSTLGDIIVGGVGGIILAIALQGIAAIQAITNIFIEPVARLATEAANFVSAFVGGAGDIVRQGAITTIQSIAPGATWAVGPLTFGFSIIAAAIGLFVMAQVVERAVTSDTIPFTFTDIPLIGAEEDQDEG